MSNNSFNEIEFCWNEIGIYGNNTCSLLDKYEHCKGCEIYIQKGRTLLNRPISSELVDEWSEIYSKNKEETDTDRISVVIFRINDEWFAIDSKYFLEVTKDKKNQKIPKRTNQYLYGIINHNGELLLCLAIDFILGLKLQNIDNKFFKNILILSFEDFRFAFPVDEILNVKSILIKDLEDVPSTLKKQHNSIASNIFHLGNIKVSYLNADKLLNQIERCLVW